MSDQKPNNNSKSGLVQLSQNAQTVPNYELIRSVGSGGMGDVFEAVHSVLKSRVAIKILKSHLIETSAFMRFQQEAKTANKLKHPNIVSVYDCGITSQGEPYMIMDLIHGETLDQILKNGPFDVSQATQIMHQICAGVAFAHSQGILHRDIKPSNVIIENTPNGSVARVLDFGIAKLLDSDEAGMLKTRTGEIFGTPSYMSPEQAEGRKLDQRSDLYSLGCVFYEMLTGQPPVVGKSAMDILYKHVNETPLSLTQASMGKKFPVSIERIVERSLAREPGNRFSSANEMMQSIDDFKAGRKVEFATAGNSSAKDGRRLWPILAGGAVALAALATIFVMTKYSGDSEVKSTSQAPAEQPVPTISSVEKAIKADAEKSADYTQSTSVRSSKQPNKSDSAVSTDSKKSGDEKSNANAFVDDDKIFANRLEKAGPQLTELPLIPNLIHDDSLKLLSNYKQLQNIDLRDCADITDLGISYIVHLPKLKRLNLTRTRVTDAAILDINSAKKLEELDLSGTQIHDKGLLALRHDLPLKNLLVKATAISDNGLEELHLFKTLRYLKLDNCKQIGNDGVAKLSQIPLDQLDLVGTSITDGVIDSLLKMPSITALGMTDTRLTGKFLHEMVNLNCLPKLTYIAVKNCHGITPADIAFFRANRKKCEIRFIPNQIIEKDLF